MPEKNKHPLATAEKMAIKMKIILETVCERVEIVGSIRRRCPMVSDVDFLLIPKFGTLADKSDLFARPVRQNLLDAMLDEWIARGWITKRRNEVGHETWGPENKHAIATATGIPVDVFITTGRHWFNTLVCKTGSAAHNIKIASAAQARGWKWHPTGAGFTRVRGDLSTELELIESEEQLFAWLGWPYQPPPARI